MKDLEPQENAPNMSGSLLVASPALLDPNFNKAVILLSAHSDTDGALGVVVNRPSGHTLGEMDDNFCDSPLAQVPVYHGGPVSTDQMILTAWHTGVDTGVFKLYFGITQEKALEIMETQPELELRGYLGYAGWSGGQLEEELNQDAWLVTEVDIEALRDYREEKMWKHLLIQIKPEFGLLGDAPEDPSVN